MYQDQNVEQSYTVLRSSQSDQRAFYKDIAFALMLIHCGIVLSVKEDVFQWCYVMTL